MGQQEKHPPGLSVLFFTEMWERFGFYTMGAMFVLYLRNGFGWTAAQATDLNSWYLMFVYASPLLGGWLADRYLGYRNSVLIGGVIFMVGYLLFGFADLWMVYVALFFLVVGNGFFKPNVSAMVGHLYPEGSPLKDRAFNIFYMGINIGAFFAPVVAEYVSGKFGFQPAFMVAAGGMVISVATLWTFRRYVASKDIEPVTPDPRKMGELAHFKPSAESPAEVQAPSPIQTPPPPGESAGEAATTADVPPMPSRAIDAIPDSRRIGALIVIFGIVIVFWMVFHQNTSTLVFWANDNTDWSWINRLTGREVSGILANSINAFFVVAFTFPLVWAWKQLDARGLEPSTPAKIGLGMFLTAVSFGILYLGARAGETETVTPEMYASGDYRVTESSLASLKEDGLPAGVLEKLEEDRKKENKATVVDRKFATDHTFAAAWTTIQQRLKADGLPDDAAEKLKKVEIEPEDGLVTNRDAFGTALDAVATKLKSDGVSDSVLSQIRAAKDGNFTGQVKLSEALGKVIGPAETSQYLSRILKRSYLFKVSPWWLILAYAVITLGELMLSPMGLSLVSKVAPVHMRGLMMGGWFVATAIGNKLTMIGIFWDRWLHSTFFIVLAAMALVMVFVLFGLLRPLKKAMPGV